MANLVKFFLLLYLSIFSFANENILIEAEEAIKLLNKKGVVFVTGDSPDIYELGHIKGSVEMYAHHLHHSDINGKMKCAPLFMCVEEAENYIGKHGIDNDTLVIAYDDYRGPNATGVYAFFKSFGHEKIKILNGGRSSIMEIDPNQKIYNDMKVKIKEVSEEEKESLHVKMKEVEKKLLVVKGRGEKVKPKKYKIDTSKINYDYIAGKEEMLNVVKDIMKNGKDSSYIVIDSRGFTEIMGERKLDNAARGGHIPGAKFIEWKNLTDFDKRLSFKEKDELQKVFDKYGVTKNKKIYAYCHVGAGRSTHMITALEMLGFEDVKVYTGSWDEWSNDMNMPIRR